MDACLLIILCAEVGDLALANHLCFLFNLLWGCPELWLPLPALSSKQAHSSYSRYLLQLPHYHCSVYWCVFTCLGSVESILLQWTTLGFDSLVRKIPLEKEMAIHSSILVWEITWTEEPGRLQSKRSQRVRHGSMTQQQQTTNNYNKFPTGLEDQFSSKFWMRITKYLLMFVVLINLNPWWETLCLTKLSFVSIWHSIQVSAGTKWCPFE